MNKKPGNNPTGVFRVKSLGMFVKLCQITEVGLPIRHVKYKGVERVVMLIRIGELLVLVEDAAQ